MGDCQRTGEPSWCVNNSCSTQPSIPPGYGKSGTGLSGCRVEAGCVYLCWVAGNTVLSHLAGDAP